MHHRITQNCLHRLPHYNHLVDRNMLMTSTVFPGRQRACYLYIKRSKFVKNEHARYTVEYFPVNNARVIYTKGLNSQQQKNENARYGLRVIH
jgi:hypothetical protein